MPFLYDIYLTRQILIPAASLIWLVRELIGNSGGFKSSLDRHEPRGLGQSVNEFRKAREDIDRELHDAGASSASSSSSKGADAAPRSGN
jgi:hypothetical protein